jgi:hypothetical protein
MTTNTCSTVPYSVSNLALVSSATKAHSSATPSSSGATTLPRATYLLGFSTVTGADADTPGEEAEAAAAAGVSSDCTASNGM